MPHRSFGSARASLTREPITFDFGVYGEESFTVLPEPSLADTFEVAEQPEVTPENLLDVTRVLARFISRMLVPEDRVRFAEALRRIPASDAGIIILAAEYITEQVTGFPTKPPANSSAGRQPVGTNSKRTSGGRTHSKR